MAQRTGPTNYQLQCLLPLLEQRGRGSALWRRVADDLCKPSRQRREVNLYTIEHYAREGETVLVPGKVLSVGELHKKVTIAAWSFSTEARRKIEHAQGKMVTIKELLEKNPEGKLVRLLG